VLGDTVAALGSGGAATAGGTAKTMAVSAATTEPTTVLRRFIDTSIPNRIPRNSPHPKKRVNNSAYDQDRQATFTS
jgi:hypothetical protein